MLRSIFLATLALMVVVQPAARAAGLSPAERAECLAKVPLPDDIRISTPAPGAGRASPYLGAWIGKWEGITCHVLITSQQFQEDRVQVVYAVQAWSSPAGYWLRIGTTKDGRLRVELNEKPYTRVEYAIDGSSLVGTYSTEVPEPYGSSQQTKVRTLRATLSPLDIDEILDSQMAKAKTCFGETPLPDDIAVVESKSKLAETFLGEWSGKWGGRACSTLIVKSITTDGMASVIYSRGALGNIPAAYHTHTAKVVGEALEFTLDNGAQASYRPRRGSLIGSYVLGSNRSTIIMKKRTP